MGTHMICRRCDKPILPGEEYSMSAKFSASGGGITQHEHKTCPPTARFLIPRRQAH
ncbi:hypothetical protein [Streptomyces sp. KLOTTS4A1]|uniref:hypothetical protein n=1 Tax=Streptomyces sp. KLOTTS4A1 TaxID=3390996 RepID=UPI0039F567E2